MFEELKTELQEWDKKECAEALYYYYPKSKKQEISAKAEHADDEVKDFRKEIQGARNAKYLKRARYHADSPEARIQKERTELQKGLRGDL